MEKKIYIKKHKKKKKIHTVLKQLTGRIPSTNHPTDLESAWSPPQSCSMAPPMMIPGLKNRVVPTSLISTEVPLVNLSSKRTKEASNPAKPFHDCCYDYDCCIL
jgi:hypothetical protein